MHRLATAAGLVLLTLCILCIVSPFSTQSPAPATPTQFEQKIVHSKEIIKVQEPEQLTPPAFDNELRVYIPSVVNRKASEADLSKSELNWRRLFPSAPYASSVSQRPPSGP